ncbi:MAG: four helix bundle protein [Flavobacteriales bacterium]|jgi:four helix bundle protein
MGSIKSFEDIEAWQKARLFCKDIYVITQEGSFSKDFGLRDQIRRAAVSIVSNIAEGFERLSDKEFARFLTFSKASAGEVRAQLYIAFDLAYINTTVFENLKEQIIVISKMISKLITYLNTKTM